MNRLLELVPKNVLAFLLIAAGTAIIIIKQPPHSVCDSQVEVVNKDQAQFLFKDPNSKSARTTRYESMRDTCKATNNPGGCYELFQDLKGLLDEIASLGSECEVALGEQKPYHQVLTESADLMARLAWGDKPPESYNTKFGWLEEADVALFCRLHDRIGVMYGETAWDSLRESTMADLPGAKDLVRNQIWDLSLFSENCARYP